jgi:hypothetical protein
MNFVRSLALSALLLTTALFPAMAQQRVSIPGTTVSVIAPEGFEPSTQFSGLIDESRGASLLIIEFPAAAYDQISSLFKDIASVQANFARQQVTIERLSMLDVQAGKVPFASGTQNVAGAIFDKWVALYRGEKTVLITMQAPQQAKLDATAVKELFESVVLSNTPSMADRLNALPFSITIAEPYRAVDTLGGLGILMTVGPLDQDPGETQPSIIVVYQPSTPVDLGDAEAVAEQLLRHTNGYADATVTTREAHPFAGLRGFVIRGTRKNEAGVEKEFAHYLGISERNQFIRLLASGDTQRMRDLKPVIDKVAASITLKEVKP